MPSCSTQKHAIENSFYTVKEKMIDMQMIFKFIHTRSYYIALQALFDPSKFLNLPAFSKSLCTSCTLPTSTRNKHNRQQ